MHKGKDPTKCDEPVPVREPRMTVRKSTGGMMSVPRVRLTNQQELNHCPPLPSSYASRQLPRNPPFSIYRRALWHQSAQLNFHPHQHLPHPEPSRPPESTLVEWDPGSNCQRRIQPSRSNMSGWKTHHCTKASTPHLILLSQTFRNNTIALQMQPCDKASSSLPTLPMHPIPSQQLPQPLQFLTTPKMSLLIME